MGNKHKRSIRRDADAFSLIMPYIGDLPLSKVHLGTIQPFINDRLASGVSGGFFDRHIISPFLLTLVSIASLPMVFYETQPSEV